MTPGAQTFLFTPSGTQYQDYTFGPVTATAASQSVGFMAVPQSSSVAAAAMLDNVRVVLSAAPFTPASLSLYPATVTGGASSRGTVTLSSYAPPAGVVVALQSDNPAATVAASVTVPGGQRSAAFPVSTADVSAATAATITATAAGVSQTATLNVTIASPSVSDLSAYATGDGKITLYWTRVVNATGYNLYRGTTSGGEDYAHPINGSTPINTHSYSGSPMDMYSDTGLTNGIEYFYTVKAVYALGESQASNEDSDTPDAAAVPWDTRNPGAILSAFSNAFSNVETSIGPLRVVGPDNTIYDGNYSAPQPQDGQFDPSTDLITFQDGTTAVLPDDEYSNGNQGSNLIRSYAYQGRLLQPDRGPFRRVMSVRGQLGIQGDISLPTASEVVINRPQDETAVIYLGMHDGPDNQEVDTGLQFSPAHVVNGTTIPAAWVVFMGSYANKFPAQQGGPLTPFFPLLNFANNSVRFAPGAYLTLKFYASAYDAATIGTTNKKICLLVADGTLYGSPDDIQFLGAASHLGPNMLQNVQMKRVHAIAQSKRILPVPAQGASISGVAKTGSMMIAVSWLNGQLAPPNYSFSNWTNPKTQPGSDGSFDGSGSPTGVGAAISWTSYPGLDYSREDNINITISTP